MDGPYNRIRRECQGPRRCPSHRVVNPDFELQLFMQLFLVMCSLGTPELSMSTWVVPTIILLYKLSASSEPYGSVLGSHSFSRFSYFFEIRRSMPRFISGFGGVDPIRVAMQTFVVAPFYAGLIKSAGAVGDTGSIDQPKHFRKLCTTPELLLGESIASQVHKLRTGDGSNKIEPKRA